VLVFLSIWSLAVADVDVDEPNTSYLRHILTTKSLDPKMLEIKSDGPNPGTNRRKFLSYTSSTWEFQWLANVGKWEEEQSICEILHLDMQSDYIHDFLTLTCSARYKAPHDNWCIIHDEFQPLWYNTANRDTFELRWTPPFPEETMELQGQLLPVVPGPEHEHIVSKFVFLDETTGEVYVEYIEPLVSHLRFPLAGCLAPVPDHFRYAFHDVTFRGWIIPPPPTLRKDRALYFDAGASDWASGRGGPSMQYFQRMWDRSNIQFDEMHAFEPFTNVDKFYETVPPAFQEKVHYQQCFVSSRPEDDSTDSPFIPNLVKTKSNPNDYVLFKLDIDSPIVENGNIEFILNDPDVRIDEILWEHHIKGNYIMLKTWGPGSQDPLSLRDSYEYFLKMRLRGIRAHSWV